MSKTECPTCGREDFKSERGMKLHHSKTHNESIAGKKLECEYCGGEYREKEYRVDRSSYCSAECRDLAKTEITGEDHPLYEKVELSCEVCSDKYRVIPARVETSRFCSDACRHKYLSTITGDDHPLYDGGEHNKYKQRDWRIFSKKYRNWVGCCENCGDTRDLQTHHDEPISMGGHLYDNTFTVLCSECHYGDFERWHPPQLEEYIDR